MMSPAHDNAMMILFGLIGLVLLVIMGTVALSQMKRRKKFDVAEEIEQIKDRRKVPRDQFLDPAKQKELEGINTPRKWAPVDDTIFPKSESEKAAAAHATEIETLGKDTSAAEVVEEKDVDLRQALRKTEANFFGRLKSLFKEPGAPAAMEDIEEVLYTSDLGPKTVQGLTAALEDKLSKKELNDPQALKRVLREEMLAIFARAKGGDQLIRWNPDGPTVIMIVGVNGAGKTTSIGKLAARYAGEGKKVLVAAGDTFRAAAGAQLKVWADRALVEIFSPEGVTDPGAVAFDAVAKARAQKIDLVLIDTAGRLHTQANLMDELKKVKRVIQKNDPTSPHETFIVLDANSGQNALMQAKEFHKLVDLTGAILTKMDGTAKGGVAVGLVDELGIPVKLIGVGERIRDLREFSSTDYVDSILGQ